MNIETRTIKAEEIAAAIRAEDNRNVARVWVKGDLVRVYVSGTRSLAGKVDGYWSIAESGKASFTGRRSPDIDFKAVNAAVAARLAVSAGRA